jgi:hypothetical protein
LALLARRIAERLAGTRFGQRALADEVDLGVFKARPSLRFYLGLFLIASSYLLGLPAMALCGYLAHAWGDPLIVALAIGVVFVAVHGIFAAGVYLSGANYAMVLLRWFAARFLRKHLSPGGSCGSPRPS